MTTVLALFWKDVTHFRRDRVAVAMTFIVA